MTTLSVTTLVRKWPCLMPSLTTVHAPGLDILLDIAIHHAHLSPEWKEAFQQAFMSDPEMYAVTDIIITSWPIDIKELPCPLHPYWQHCET